MDKRMKIRMSVIALFIFSGVSLCAMGAGENRNSKKDGAAVEVKGIIRIVGSMPFTETVVTDDSGDDYFITAEEKSLFNDMDQTAITVKGNLYTTDMVLANGQKIGVRRTLRNVTIVSK